MRSTGRACRCSTSAEFGTDYEAAQHAYRAAEQEARGRPDLDVVLLSADSLQTIQRTHSGYFEPKSLLESCCQRRAGLE